MTGLINKLKNLNDILDLPFEGVQTFDAIANTWQMDETIPILRSTSKLVKRDEDTMIFEVEIQPGGIFPVHFHDCKEVCLIKQGVLMDHILYPDQFFSVGDVYHVPALTKHRPQNASRTQPVLLTVRFTKVV